MEVRSRRGRAEKEMSPDRAKGCMQQPRGNPIKKVQVVYYLSRNGLLEHPHYMEVTHLANHQLRLRDVTDRLTVLRGKGMPFLYSWSCKRSYKNGYVWNDLAENDIIYPSDGAEYVLKGSELVEGCPAERLNVSNNRHLIQEPNLHSKRKQVLEPIQQPRQLQTQATKYYQEYEEEEEEGEGEQESQEEYEDEEKTCYTSSTTPHSGCSRGASTDELLEEQAPHKTLITESLHHDSPTPSVLSEKPDGRNTSHCSKHFVDGDPVVNESVTGRNSVLLQIISCGNLTVPKAKTSEPSIKQSRAAVKVNSTCTNVVVRSESNLHKGVLYKTAVKVAKEDVINYMPENPRFGNLQSGEREYFSGSIIESMSENRVVDEPGLKRSNSYNEERCARTGMEETVKEEIEEKAARGKCIPLKKSSSSSTRQAKK